MQAEDRFTHSRFMRQALYLSARQLGRTQPNPAVGCVIVQSDAVVGIGVTADGGRPHAETQALAMAGAATRGATAYVTLEPCAHVGETPSCADALIAAGITRVVCAMRDPDARTNGKGLARLREAGIDIVEDVEHGQAALQHEGFIRRVQSGRPMVALKIAASLDGRIAAADGGSQWITGQLARQRGHVLRSTHDAMLTGIGTVLADNPRLTCRLPGMEHRPLLRIVLDTQLRMPPHAALFDDITTQPLWVVCDAKHTASKAAQALQERGASIVGCAIDDANHVDLAACLQLLGARGLTRVLAECGPRLAAALIAADAVDWLHWFSAPGLLGEGGAAAAAPLPVPTLDAMKRFAPHAQTMLDADHYHLYRRAT